MGNLSDPLIGQSYLGFMSVSAVTVYELAIKDIFIDFSQKKHNVFGQYLRASLERMNGRISLGDLRTASIGKYGLRYRNRFEKQLDARELESLSGGNGSIKSSYGNIIQWRNRFVHEGIPPNTTTFQEVKKSYERGKGVIHCLAETMVR